MCKKLMFLVSMILLLVLAGNAMAQIDPATVTDGNVYLFENVGADVPDDSANSNTATLIGNPQVVDGLKGKALQFDGIDDGVFIPDAATINLSTHQNHTVVAIFKCDDMTKSEKQCVYDEGGTTRGLTIYVHEGLVYAGGWNLSDYAPEWTGTFISAPISSNQWVAVAAVLRDAGPAQEDDKFEMWMDGNLIGIGPGGQLQSRSNDCGIGYHNSQVKYHDGNVSATGSYFQGAVDEIWIINRALSEVELKQWSGKPWPYAYGPSPADGAMYEDTWVNLTWRPGKFAVSHDVYLGDILEDVNSGAEAAFQGNQLTTDFIAGFPGSAYPEGLVAGTTYYWRIDEVNDAEPNSPWVGSVWSFSIPPLTAYSPVPADDAESVALDAKLSWAPGFGAKLHTVYFGDNFDDVNSASGGLLLADLTFTPPGPLELAKTYYWSGVSGLKVPRPTRARPRAPSMYRRRRFSNGLPEVLPLRMRCISGQIRMPWRMPRRHHRNTREPKHSVRGAMTPADLSWRRLTIGESTKLTAPDRAVRGLVMSGTLLRAISL